MIKQRQIRQIVDVFGESAMCGIQEIGCPCNTCFHSLGSNNTDWCHLTWQLVLAIRGDYLEDASFRMILDDIKDELNR